MAAILSTGKGANVHIVSSSAARPGAAVAAMLVPGKEAARRCPPPFRVREPGLLDEIRGII